MAFETNTADISIPSFLQKYHSAEDEAPRQAPAHPEQKRLVVGVTGASGTPLATRLLNTLAQIPQVEVHAVVSDGAFQTARFEGQSQFEQALSLADHVHDMGYLAAPVASGTFQAEGMVIVPCSMKTVAGIAAGYSDNLILRAADVTIKEQRPLVLVARESPLSAIHLRNLHTLALLPGVCIMPPMLTYYHGPSTVEDMEAQLIARILDRFNLEVPGFKRWS